MLIRNSIEQGCCELLKNNVIAYPTESVFGLGALANSNKGIQKLLALKQRSEAKGLIVIASDFAQVRPWVADLTDEQTTLLVELHEGYTHTWIVPVSDACPKILQGQFGSLALRITRHPVAKALCQSLGMPIVSTSANLSGMPAAKTKAQVVNYFDETVHIVEGTCGTLQCPTRIKDIQTGRIIRA